MSDLPTAAHTLLDNFRTIRITVETQSGPPDPAGKDWWAVIKAKNRCEAIRRILRQGRHRFIDHLERDPDGGWRLHVFPVDRDAAALLNAIGDCGPGDPVTFDPGKFVFQSLQEMEQLDIP
jgi:hypothetical protein